MIKHIGLALAALTLTGVVNGCAAYPAYPTYGYGYGGYPGYGYGGYGAYGGYGGYGAYRGYRGYGGYGAFGYPTVRPYVGDSYLAYQGVHGWYGHHHWREHRHGLWRGDRDDAWHRGVGGWRHGLREGWHGVH